MVKIMNRKKIISLLAISVFCIGAINFMNITPVMANGEIPNEYYQGIDINGNYVYNITEFGESSTWINFTSGSEGTWATNIGGQIIINFTGFYDRDPFDSQGDAFPDTNMSWMDINIYKYIAGSPQINFTLNNVSNSEVARNLKLGFSGFQSGFLIAINHTDLIKANATLEANGVSGPTAYLTTEETYNFLSFKFEQFGAAENQKTELVYDKKSGLLVKANTSLGNYKLMLFLTNYTLDIENEYIYDVDTFEPLGWAIWPDLYGNLKDIYATASGRGWIIVNFTGYYNRDPLLWDPDPFKYTEPGRPWQDIKVLYQGDIKTDVTMALDNVSNSECANALLISFPGFLSGFLMPKINNNTFNITAEVLAASWFTVDRQFTYNETDLTIDMWFKCGGAFPQETRLIYEKMTGLLMYVNTEGQNYHLELSIQDYPIPGSEGSKGNTSSKIFSFPILILLSVSIIATMIIISSIRKKYKLT